MDQIWETLYLEKRTRVMDTKETWSERKERGTVLVTKLKVYSLFNLYMNTIYIDLDSFRFAAELYHEL